MDVSNGPTKPLPIEEDQKAYKRKIRQILM